MSDVRNILVGAASLFVSRGTGNNRPVTKPNTAASGLAKGDINSGAGSMKAYLAAASANWRDVGYTNTGLEVAYEPGYSDVMVDQLLDAARLFKSTIKVMLKTELTEATLENINLVFGQNDSQYTYNAAGTGAATAVLGADTASSSSATLAIAGGALGDAPVERTIVAVGNAPTRFGATGNVNPGGSASTSTVPGFDITGGYKERVYVARRVVQIESSTHGLKRDTATVFPVQFRCLPDDNDLYDGAEYGVIIDRVYTP